MDKHKAPYVSLDDFMAKDTPAHLIAQAETISGKIMLIAVFALCMLLLGPSVMPVIVSAITLAAFIPRYRWHIIALATFAVFLITPFWFDPKLPVHVAVREDVINDINVALLEYAMGGVFFLFAMIMIAGRRRFAHRPPFSRPIVSLLVLYFMLVICADQHILHGVPQVILWSFIDIFGGYFWFLGYALLNYKETSIPLLLQFGVFHPFWGSTTTPFGKGITNLRHMEAKNSRELALAHISGVKLIVSCCILKVLFTVFKGAVHSRLAIPTLDDAFAQQLSGNPYQWYECWCSLIAAFFEAIFHIAILGNTFIACARMTGFQLLKNTDNPLQSKTIAEFWNRYYFYFKELLVEFFFYPTFLRCFKKHRRLRIVFATFMAAGVGNALFHFMKDIHYVFELGLWRALQGYQTYLFYCVLLASGIAVSQLRPHPAIHTDFFRGSVLPSLKVAAFFCFIHIFSLGV